MMSDDDSDFEMPAAFVKVAEAKRVLEGSDDEYDDKGVVISNSDNSNEVVEVEEEEKNS